MNLKQKIAAVLAAAMVFQTPVYAETPRVFTGIPRIVFGNHGKKESDSAGKPFIIRASTPNAEHGSGTGTLKIEVTGAAPSKASQWNVMLASADNPTVEGSFTLDAPAENRYSTASLTLDEIPAGDYTMTLSPDGSNEAGYVPYEQDITIRDRVSTVKLINGRPDEYGYTDAGSENYGILSMGDIDSDGELTEADLHILTEAAAVAADPEDGDPEHERADINGDREINLFDISCFAKYYQNQYIEEHRTATQIDSPRISKEDVQVATDNNAEPYGEDTSSVEEMFSGSAEKPLTVSAEEPLSEETPAVIATEFTEAKEMDGLVIDPVAGSENSIVDGEIIVTDDDGNERVFTVKDGIATEKDAASRTSAGKAIRSLSLGAGLIAFAAEPDTSSKSARPIVVDLGGQVAVKKIKIKVTKTLSDANLVDISKVEFYDDMESRIPEPELSMPEILKVTEGNEEFSVTWKNIPNVTSYEVTVSGDTDGGQATGSRIVETNSITVNGFAGFTGDSGALSGDLLNGHTYTVVVRSVNGSWRSEGVSVSVKPNTTSLPPAPENVVLDPGYCQIRVSWKNMKDTLEYTVHYAEVLDGDSIAEEQSVMVGAVYSHTISDLKNDTEYEIWITGHNDNGEGSPSIRYRARTSTLNPPVTPNYKLINYPVDGKELTDHVVSATKGVGSNIVGFDSMENGNVVVDGDYATSWVLNDWDAGYYYGNRMPTITFDQEFEMNTVVVIPDENQKFPYSGGRIFYKAEDGTEKEAPSRMTAYSSNGKYYYMLTSYAPFTTDQVRLALYAYSSNRRISVAELKFYHYDTVEDEIFGLFDDIYHITLRGDVNQDTIEGLRKKLEYVDDVSQEQNPRKEDLEKELDNAEDILANKDGLSEIMIVDNKDAESADEHITFKGGLNTYQPVGISALAGDMITVYVGGPNVRSGESTRLELIEGQYHGSSAAVFTSLGYLKGGLNTIQVKAVDQMTEYERGGQLYIRYTGNAGADQYGVRILGGRKNAVLDLSDVTERTEKVELAEAYLKEIEEQLSNAKAYHDADHGADSEAVKKYDYDPKNCIYDATDIVSRYAMFSTSADQVLEGLKSSEKSQAEQLVDTMDAMDQMLELYYQHKGLSDAEDAGAKNRMPVSRINIRYQRMFYGAFMYAGGKHIGIEWPELAGLMGATPVEADENGKYQSGKYFGWGIAHEIGHEINESAYVTAEVTNNYFALLSQAEQSEDYNNDVRFDYDDIYKKVTSGTKGKDSNVFTQLAMYWQLHLAYDLGGYNYKTYDTYEEQYNNLFWARVDSIVRDNSLAPGQKADEATGTEANLLDLNTDKDNKLMRLAVAASGKDLLEIFRRYGYEPNEGTIKYASQFEKEDRGIWFANDNLRAKQIEAGQAENKADSVEVSGSIKYTDGSNRVEITMNSTPDIWMYEIYRSERVKNEIIKRPVGYAEAGADGTATFTDVIGSINNRAFTYEAVGYDMFYNPTSVKEIGEVKVKHDGLIDKSAWTVTSNLTNEQLTEPDADNPDILQQPGLTDMIDDAIDTAFTGSLKPDESREEEVLPEIIIDFHNQETITGVRYKADVSFKAYVSMDASEWTAVEMKTTEDDADGKLAYFDDGTSIYTYDASYLKLVAVDAAEEQEITVNEISVLGQTGDNVEMTAEDGIGILSETYINQSASIPEGSLVFTGTYKGNPAYNVVLLWDEEGNIVGGADEEGTVYAEQIIFAPQPSGKLTDISEGHWVYYIAPEHVESAKAALAGHKVRAELYRVDNALTNEGERLVSSTTFVTVPEEIPNLQLSTGQAMAED